MDELINASPVVLLTAFLNGVGWVVKSSTPLDNKWIPALLSLLGAIAYPGLVSGWNVKNLMLGFCIGAASVGCHQILVQMKGTKNEDSITSK